MDVNSSQATGPAKPLTKALWGATLTSYLGIVLALVCLRQWRSPEPWSRLDLYALCYLVLSALLTTASALTFLRSAFRSKDVAREALGLSYDPAMVRWSAFLSIGDLAVVLDYGQLHLVPALERPVLQGLGLAIGVAGAAWLIWTDRWLGRHFANPQAAGRMMTGGPYRLVRHPRYAGFLALKVGMPLLFASILGWLLLLPWAAVIAQRIRREEPHLHELFRAEYDAYARRTARLVPGIY